MITGAPRRPAALPALTFAPGLVLLGGLTLSACTDSDLAINETKTGDDTTVVAKMADSARDSGAATGNLEHWPLLNSPIDTDLALETRIDQLLEQMTLAEKVGQMIQADHSNVTADEVRQYHLGSVLNGGNSVPGGSKYATAADALAEADGYWEASVDKSEGRAGIPIIWGTDAVHGHNNMVGATIFPHNIGLGAMRNPALIEQIGQATATEVAVTGLDWSFAPTLAVTQNDRWGRTYESYSEDPAVVASYAGAMVNGIQGRTGEDEFLADDRVIASAKHFLGDGGTVDGIDQGDNQSNEAELATVHGAGYGPALRAGAQTVMASFSSWHGKKLHGHRYLLTDVLKNRMGFDGFVVGDWNGHGQVEGCDNESCPQSIIAGVDMLMAPDSWKGLYQNTLRQAQEGLIPSTRIDDAVRRILRVKARAGVLDKGKPSSRPLAGQQALLGNSGHRRIARLAARQSLVLLKNNHKTLPLRPDQTILVVGDGADNIAKQCGGWTLSWQGDGNSNADFPNGTSIYQGIRDALQPRGGQALLSVDGSFEQKPDAAIVVFGEDPYAEFQGDMQHVGYEVEQSPNLDLLRSLKSQGIPTVAVFLSGRPLWVNPHLNQADAFVAAWLPGTEGGAIADLLIAASDGKPRFDFAGRLSFSWPTNARQAVANVGDQQAPLFPLGYGLSYADDETMGALASRSGLAKLGADYRPVLLFANGKLQANMKTFGHAPGQSPEPVTPQVATNDEAPMQLRFASRDRQDDSLALQWSGQSTFLLSTDNPLDTGGINFDSATLVFDIQVSAIDAGASLTVGLDCGADCGEPVDISEQLRQQKSGQWHQLQLQMSCFGDGRIGLGQLRKLQFNGTGSVGVTINRIAIEPAKLQQSACASAVEPS